MTALAIETASQGGAAHRSGFVIASDGSYAARLAGGGEAWYPERWTLDGPEPYAVPLPADQPEEPGTEVLPLADGRVLIHREVAGRHIFSLLYPTGPKTGELALGAVEFAGPMRLLPPAPGGSRAYALAVGPEATAVWLVAGGAFGPEHVAQVPGRCAGGVWLDRAGRMLALDREAPGGGVVKAVSVDLERGGEVTPLLQIAEHSNDRLLLADPDSGLIVIRSDAPGEDRLGWGVLGSTRPVRFPECLRLEDCVLTPFAAQPGQVLMPEACAVAVRIDRAPGAAGPVPGSWVGVWRPADRRLYQLAPPGGWLAGAGLWTREGVLRLPFTTGAVPCGVAEVGVPVEPEAAAPEVEAQAPPEEAPAAAPWRPVPLQQASLTGRMHRVGVRVKREAEVAPPEPEDAVPSVPSVLGPITRVVRPAGAPGGGSGAEPVDPSAAREAVPPSVHAAAPTMVRAATQVRVPVVAVGPPSGAAEDD
ncbi:hypothetical protein GCM10010329_14780 [Streptomyces spiroverticillatus]|uniref:Uncharacterized protein n=1 Tax=Streptomyces finlayi TaxID=67296 RepID=A0A918X2W1_9ACTN|nr:hypothetical protein [Streptomyces finlayi]GGZ94484.1 hypothetical protein GCM10010329_14780 [Streptomyces spiroverticillatus]GHD06880.1 hypothetical protein GCM10010334_58810 [Streptomyces finlayi]